MNIPAGQIESIAHAAAQALVHFVWQGAVVWMVALAVLHTLRAATPQARYAAGCWMLVVLALCPLATFAIVYERPVSVWATRPVTGRAIDVADGVAANASQPGPAWPAARVLAAHVSRYERWILTAWLAGVSLLAMRLTAAALAISRIKRRRQPLPAHLEPLVERIVTKLGFRRRPTIGVVERLSQAMAVGIFTPLVLLPTSWLSELPPDVLETVIAHELAHLRRFDLAINALQRVVECVLFFHPVAWWLSRRVRIEREICCDTLAVTIMEDRARYAQALTFLADRRVGSREPLVAAAIGGPRMVLLERIRQVLTPHTPRQTRFYGISCALAGAAAASIAWLAGVLLVNAAPAPHATVPAPSQLVGSGVNSNAGLVGTITADSPQPAPVPTEHNNTTLPDYTIEPPDVLHITVSRLVPNRAYRIEAGDVVQIDEPGRALTRHTVDAQGRIDLGSRGGVVGIGGMNEAEATESLRRWLAHLRTTGLPLLHPRATIRVVQAGCLQPIRPEHLVDPDGNVNLGNYGQVNVAGLTLAEAKQRIDKQLAHRLRDPDVTVEVVACNSKVYYVVTAGGEAGDTVARFPITGNETVLDALSQVPGFSSTPNKNIWIARPAPGSGGVDTILQVNWQEITKGAATAANYQLLPGDRLFISLTDREPSIAPLKPASAPPQ